MNAIKKVVLFVTFVSMLVVVAVPVAQTEVGDFPYPRETWRGSGGSDIWIYYNPYHGMAKWVPVGEPVMITAPNYWSVEWGWDQIVNVKWTIKHDGVVVDRLESEKDMVDYTFTKSGLFVIEVEKTNAAGQKRSFWNPIGAFESFVVPFEIGSGDSVVIEAPTGAMIAALDGVAWVEGPSGLVEAQVDIKTWEQRAPGHIFLDWHAWVLKTGPSSVTLRFRGLEGTRLVSNANLPVPRWWDLERDWSKFSGFRIFWRPLASYDRNPRLGPGMAVGAPANLPRKAVGSP